MHRKEKIRSTAKRLLMLSQDEDGRISSQRVQTVLEALRKQPVSHYLAVLRYYGYLVTRHMRQEHASVESASNLSDQTMQTIQDTLSQYYQRRISAELRPNSDLIAGYRITVGDDLWENNIHAKLEHLRTQVTQ